eukprot:SAG31_NODE_36471_length_313_cov_0.682243_1_plen_48_part_00
MYYLTRVCDTRVGPDCNSVPQRGRARGNEAAARDVSRWLPLLMAAVL